MEWNFAGTSFNCSKCAVVHPYTILRVSGLSPNQALIILDPYSALTVFQGSNLDEELAWPKPISFNCKRSGNTHRCIGPERFEFTKPSLKQN